MTTTASRTRPRRVEVREQLLRAAAAAFLEHSYADVSVTTIAAAAGFTKGAVYSSFGGKPELFAAVVAEQFSSYIDGAVTDAMAAADADGTQDAPRAVAASLTRALVGHQRLPALLAEFRGLASRHPELATVYADLRLRQRLELQELLASTAVRIRLSPEVDLAVAATLLLTCANSFSLEHAAAPTSISAPLIEAMLTHVLTGILA